MKSEAAEGKLPVQRVAMLETHQQKMLQDSKKALFKPGRHGIYWYREFPLFNPAVSPIYYCWMLKTFWIMGCYLRIPILGNSPLLFILFIAQHIVSPQAKKKILPVVFTIFLTKGVFSCRSENAVIVNRVLGQKKLFGAE